MSLVISLQNQFKPMSIYENTNHVFLLGPMTYTGITHEYQL